MRPHRRDQRVDAPDTALGWSKAEAQLIGQGHGECSVAVSAPGVQTARLAR